eukprot:11493-Heterococcus_DN1.PRE.2
MKCSSSKTSASIYWTLVHSPTESSKAAHEVGNIEDQSQLYRAQQGATADVFIRLADRRSEI